MKCGKVPYTCQTVLSQNVLIIKWFDSIPYVSGANNIQYIRR